MRHRSIHDKIDEVLANQHVILAAQAANQRKIMAAIDDLETTQGKLIAEALNDIMNVLNKLSSLPPDDTVRVQALVKQGNDAITAIHQKMIDAGLITPEPPTPPTEPAPTA